MLLIGYNQEIDWVEYTNPDRQQTLALSVRVSGDKARKEHGIYHNEPVEDVHHVYMRNAHVNVLLQAHNVVLRGAPPPVPHLKLAMQQLSVGYDRTTK